MQAEAAERHFNSHATGAQEAHELLQNSNDKLQKRIADRDAKLDDFAEQLVRLPSLPCILACL